VNPNEKPAMQSNHRSRSVVNKLIAMTIGVLVAAGCGSSTNLEQTWTTPVARTQPPLQNVVTVFFSDNVTIRRAGEDHLAADLLGKGVRATPSYAVLQNGELSQLETVKSKLTSMGYDGMVTMRIVEKHHELEYLPPTFDGYWGYAYPYFFAPGIYSPGYLYTETVVRVETAAYSLRTGQLVWSALTKTIGDDADKLIHETSRVIAGELTKKGLASPASG